jgi:hypothetical protein
MIGTGHLLTGGALGVAAAAVLPPALAVPVALGAGVLSHHLLDLLPHTDADTFWPEGPRPRPRPWTAYIVTAVEVVLGVVLTGLLFAVQHPSPAFIAGAAGGLLPDLLDEVPLWQARFRRTGLGAAWHRWHLRLHCASMANAWRTGLVIDAVVVAGGLCLLLI